MDSARVLTIAVADNTSLGITVFNGSCTAGSPVVICFPAMGVAASYYESLARALASIGIIVVTADLRGLGLSSVRVSSKIDFGYQEMISYDYQAIVDRIKEEFPDRPLVLLGHSLGGQLSCLFAGAHPELVSGLILIATCSVHYRQWPFPHNLGVLVLEQFARLTSRLIGYYPGYRFGFGGKEARTQIRDWACQGWTGRYELKGSKSDYEMLLSELELPVLALSFSDDILCPVGPVTHLLDKMQRADKTHMVLTPNDFGNSPVGHSGWLKRPHFLVPHVRDWLEKSHSHVK